MTVRKARSPISSPGAHARLDRDKAVLKYRISKGPSMKRVPNLTGKPESDAYQAAQDAGFMVGKVTTEYSDKVERTG